MEIPGRLGLGEEQAGGGPSSTGRGSGRVGRALALTGRRPGAGIYLDYELQLLIG